MLTNYQFYKEVFHGSQSQRSFERAQVESEAWINVLTMGRVEQLDPIPESVQKAVCAVADLVGRDLDREGKSSETVGSHSVSWESRDEIDRHREITKAANVYLYGTGLLYKGAKSL